MNQELLADLQEAFGKARETGINWCGDFWIRIEEKVYRYYRLLPTQLVAFTREDTGRAEYLEDPKQRGDNQVFFPTVSREEFARLAEEAWQDSQREVLLRLWK